MTPNEFFSSCKPYYSARNRDVSFENYSQCVLMYMFNEKIEAKLGVNKQLTHIGII